MQNQTNREQPWTILSLIQWTTSYFKTNHIESPRIDAEILLAHTLDLKRIDLYLRYDQPLDPAELSRFKALIKRRIQREPIAYITGIKEFWAMDFLVTPEVLIPRPETECLVEAALSCLSEDKTMQILELGSGSGAITVALASEQPSHQYVASDRSLGAILLARVNARRQNQDLPISFLAGDWFKPFTGELFDMILSNPPYIRSNEIPQLQPEISQYEPYLALDGGMDGLQSIRHLIEQAPGFLRPGSYLILEMGYDQKTDIEAMAKAVGEYDIISFKKDYSRLDRVALLRKKP